MVKWKVIINATNYSISNTGVVKRNETGKVIKHSIDRYGYPRCGIKGVDNKYLYSTIHRLVAIAFVPGRSNERNAVNHIDGNKLNNRSDNLEWVTNRENTMHAIENGLIKTPINVVVTDLSTGIVKDFISIKELARYIDVKAGSLVPYIRLSNIYPFMDRYIIEAESYTSVNTDTHGERTYVYDTIADKMLEFPSRLECQYWTGIRDINYAKTNPVKRAGYIVSNKPIIDKGYSGDYTYSDRQIYLSEPYRPRPNVYMSHDYRTKSTKIHATVSEMYNYITNAHPDLPQHIRIRNLIDKLAYSKTHNLPTMFLGYGVTPNQVVDWGVCNLELFYNSYYGMRYNYKVFRVNRVGIDKIVIGLPAVIKDLSGVLTDKVLNMNYSNITSKIINKELTDPTITVTRVNKIKI